MESLHGEGFTLLQHSSGLGSGVLYTQTLREKLKSFIIEQDIALMIDAPCGAMAWQDVFLKEIWSTRPQFKYIGLDVTRSVVAANRKRWSREDRVVVATADLTHADFVQIMERIVEGPRFAKLRISAEDLSERSLVLTRDALQ